MKTPSIHIDNHDLAVLFLVIGLLVGALAR
jgi:hypothetical protein